MKGFRCSKHSLEQYYLPCSVSFPMEPLTRQQSDSSEGDGERKIALQRQEELGEELTDTELNKRGRSQDTTFNYLESHSIKNPFSVRLKSHVIIYRCHKTIYIFSLYKASTQIILLYTKQTGSLPAKWSSLVSITRHRFHSSKEQIHVGTECSTILR